jgi:hypothetical protein
MQEIDLFTHRMSACLHMDDHITNSVGKSDTPALIFHLTTKSPRFLVQEMASDKIRTFIVSGHDLCLANARAMRCYRSSTCTPVFLMDTRRVEIQKNNIQNGRGGVFYSTTA